MPAHEPFVPGCIYGTGEEQNWYDGVPQPASFQGMSPWWTVPTNWYCRSTNGQIFVSPTWDFSSWTFAAKVDQDGALKFQFPYGVSRNGIPTVRMDQFTVTYPPTTNPTQQPIPQIIFFTGSTPQVLPTHQDQPALAYNALSYLYGWNTMTLQWIALSTTDGLNFTPDPSSSSSAGSGQVIFFVGGDPMFPGETNQPAIGYDANDQIYGWHPTSGLYIPISTTDGVPKLGVTPYNGLGGQLVFGSGSNPQAPSNTGNPQIYYSALSTIAGWNLNVKEQLALIS